MCIKPISLLLVLGLYSSLFAQTLIPYLDNGKYGFANVAGEIIIAPKYDHVENFTAHGVALTRINDQIIYINKAGKELLLCHSSLKPKINYVTNSNSSQNSRIFIKDTLDNLRQISYGDKSFQFINIKTSYISNTFIEEELKVPMSVRPSWFEVLFRYGYFIGKTKDNAYDVLNTEGEVVLKPTNDAIIWNEELISYHENDSTILFNPIVKTKIAVPYYSIHDLIDNHYLIVSNRKSIYSYPIGNSSYNKGLITTNGEIILDAKYKELSKSIGHRLIANNGNAFLMDYNGKIIRSLQNLKNIYKVNDFCLVSELQNGKKVLMDADGNFLTNERYDAIEYHNVEKYFTWKIGEYSGILDRNLNFVIRYKCDAINFCSDRNYFYVIEGFRTGIIDSNKKIIVPIQYDECYFTHEKFIQITLGRKVGLANLKGKILFEPIYEEIQIVKKDNRYYFRPKKDNLYACYDENLNWLSGFNSKTYYISDLPIDRYYQENAYHFTDMYGNPLGYSAKNYNSGYVSTDSTYIVVTNDDNKINVLLNESSFADKYAVNGEIIKIQIKSGLISLSRNGLQGVVNYQNKPVLPFEKREIKEITEKLIISEERGKYYLYDNSGHQIFKDGFDYFRDYENNGFRAVANKIEGKTYEYITPECLTGKPDTIIKNHMNFGYINRNGEIIVPMKYQSASSYTDNLVVVTKGFNNGEKETFILDTVGNIVLSTPYDNLYQLEQFDESLYYVATLEKKLGLINLKGKVILPFEYKMIYGFHKLDILCVEDFGNSCHLVNRFNKILYTAKQFQNKNINSNCIELPNKKFLIFPDGKSVIIDLEGNFLFSFPEQNVQLTKLDKIDVIEVIGENYKYYINAQTLKAYKN